MTSLKNALILLARESVQTVPCTNTPTTVRSPVAYVVRILHMFLVLVSAVILIHNVRWQYKMQLLVLST